MNVTTFLVVAISIQAILVGLDLMDRYLTRAQRDDGESLRPEGLGFLIVVLVVFLAIQFGGLSLVPGSADVMANVRAFFAERLGMPLAIERPSWWVLAAAAVFAYYVAGLCDYLVHRFFSHSRWFFFTHEYHHLPKQVFLTMPGIAARPFAVIAVFPVVLGTIVSTYGVLALLGLPLWDLSALKLVVLAQILVNTVNHSCFMRRFWIIHRWARRLAITSPQEHILHHAVDLEGNYGNFTTLWDRLFRTYLDPAREEHRDHRLGLAYDQDFLGTLTLGRFKLPGRWRERWQVGRHCNIESPEERERATTLENRDLEM